MDSNTLNWNDLKYVVSVSEAGSVSGAARRLGVNHATVLRRIASLEAELGHRLFDRNSTGYRSTPFGDRVINCATQVRTEVQTMERELGPKQAELEGSIRLTTTDSLLDTVIGPALRTFQQAHPKIDVELLVSNQILALEEHHADVAIRPTRSVPEKVTANLVCQLGFAIYANQAFLDENPNAPNANTRWAGITLSQPTPTHYWMQTHMPEARIAVRANSFASLSQLVEQGHGLAVLPCCLGERSNLLVRVGDTLTELQTSLWVMAPTELIGVARISALCQHMWLSLAAQVELISGQTITN